jgi:hypothetical protein
MRRHAASAYVEPGGLWGPFLAVYLSAPASRGDPGLHGTHGDRNLDLTEHAIRIAGPTTEEAT